MISLKMGLFAQNKGLTNHQLKEITILQDSTYQLDSLSIVPGSVNITIDGQEFSKKNYYIQNNTLIFKEHIINELNTKKVFISYRSFEVNFESQHQDLDSTLWRV